MSKYKVGDVVRAPISYFDDKKGYYTSQYRRWVIVKIEGEGDDENITVSCTGQIHQSNKYKGIIIKRDSVEGKKMNLDIDTFIYCNKTITFLDKEILRKSGECPLIEQILKLLEG